MRWAERETPDSAEQTAARQNLFRLFHGQAHDIREGSAMASDDAVGVLLDRIGTCFV
jgi:hypothetical protein